MFVPIIIINSHIPVMFEENSVKLLSWIPLTNLEILLFILALRK